MPTLKIKAGDLERLKAKVGETYQDSVEGLEIRLVNTADGLKCQGMANGYGERKYTSIALPPIADQNTFKPSTVNYAKALASLDFSIEGNTLTALGVEYRSKTDGANLADLGDLEKAYEAGDVRKIEFRITIRGAMGSLKAIRDVVTDGDVLNVSEMTTARKVLAIVNEDGLDIKGYLVSQGVKPVWKDSEKGWLRIEVISEGFDI